MKLSVILKKRSIAALLSVTVAASFYAGDLARAGDIAISVNNGVVTQYQVTQRARFLRLTGAKGDTVERAKKELIDEELQFQEARRFDIKTPPNAVENAFASIGQRFKLSSSQFSQELRRRGVDPNTLKERLRAQIIWAEFVRGRTRAEAGPRRQKDVTSILFNRGSDEKNRKVTEYTLERFVFVLKRDASQAVVRQKIREAETFRTTYKSCEDAAERARAITGVVVTPLGRFTTDTLPPAMKDDVIEAGVGNFTPPKRGELGIGMLAVCKEREIVDNSSPTANFDTGQFDSETLVANSKQWLDELRTRAKIVNRN
ncbi:MAG: hypothetical protein AAGE89_17030 [Pseudomonadota bacterium]